MSNWYTCKQCGAKSNGWYAHEQHEFIQHPEERRKAVIRQLTQAIKDTEETLVRQRESLAFLEAGHTLQEENDRHSAVLHERLIQSMKVEQPA